jgi:PAS domain S-box-containing protein
MDVVGGTGAWEKIIKNSVDIICTIDRNGSFIKINEACKSVLGYESREVEGKHLLDFIHPEDLTKTLDAIQDVVRGQKVSNFKNRYIHKRGGEVLILWSAVWSEEDEVMVCVGRDISDQLRVWQKEQLHYALVEHGVDMQALFDEGLTFLYSGGSTLKQLGYFHEQLVGTNALEYIHPDDIPLVKDSVSKVLHSDGYIEISEFRFKDAKGEWRWLETTLSNQLHNPAVKALVTSSRDITQRVSDRLKLLESEQRFRSLFDHHLDMVLFQNKEGIIVDVNTATLSFFELQKQELVNRPLSDFLSPEIIPACEQAFQKALKGEPVRLEVEIPFEGKGTFTFDVANIPVKVDGESIGVYVILRDITERNTSNKIIKRQAEKLNTIMESITDAFCTLDRDWKFTYVNSEFERLLQADRNQLIGKNIWEAYPQEVGGEFYKQYYHAVETGRAVHFEAYYEKLDVWFQVKVFPSEEGLSVYFDDITESVNSRQELEKLSLVASKATNGVVILDAQGYIEWVNNGFSKLTGYSFNEVKGKYPGSFLTGAETDQGINSRIKETLKKDKPFKEEILNYKKSGEKMWLLLDFTPILNDAGKITSFIAIVTDITCKKEAEANQLQLTRDLFRQNQDLQQFTYIVSHNLRSPVANAMGLVEMLHTIDKASDSFDTPLAYLKTSINQLDTVLKDLNTILSIRDKKDTIEREKIQLVQVCQQVIEDLQEPLKECGGEVVLGIKENVYVRGNKAYLYSIFFNLLLNAIKYRSLERTLKISIKCFDGPDRGGTIISFSDNGLGFDMSLAGDKVFKLYKRFHTNSEGRGIGLFLVKTHLEAMGGHIEVSSQVNKGTRFLIYLS